MLNQVVSKSLTRPVQQAVGNFEEFSLEECPVRAAIVEFVERNNQRWCLEKLANRTPPEARGW